MPKLNKCKYREARYGFADYIKSRNQTHFSTRKWFMCQLLKDEHPNAERHTQIECKGRNCGRYEEAD